MPKECPDPVFLINMPLNGFNLIYKPGRKI
jgi:hypothetical protein